MQLFERLIGVSGIGPRLALTALSGIEPPELVRAVRNGDVARLTGIPGVGKKTAERMIVELRDRLPDVGSEDLVPATGTAAPDDLRGDVLSALLNLGYHRPLAEKSDRRGVEGIGRSRVRARAPASASPAPLADPSAHVLGGVWRRAGARVKVRAPTVAAMTDPRVVSSVRADEEVQYETGLRPKTLDDYIGQDRLRENIEVSIQAARQRNEAVDHVLLYGPPGLGKTTLAYVIGNELGVPVRATSGPVLEKPGDLAAILTNLAEREVLFIDEIHRHEPRHRGDPVSRRWRTTSWTS